MCVDAAAAAAAGDADAVAGTAADDEGPFIAVDRVDDGGFGIGCIFVGCGGADCADCCGIGDSS